MRLVVLSPPVLGSFEEAVLAPFFGAEEHDLTAAVIDTRPPPSTWKKIRRHVERGRAGLILVQAARKLRPVQESGTPAAEVFERYGIPTIPTDAPYEAATLDSIRAHAPEAMVRVGGFGIVKPPLLELAPLGVLSYHHGNIRTYRGQPFGFWEVYNGESEMGVTVQRLSAGIDSGAPIVEMTIPIGRGDTVAEVQARALRRSAGMMFEAVSRLQDPSFTPEAVEELGDLYTLPNLRQWLRMQGKLLRRRLG